MRFGISTHLFHHQRLRREHLADIAGHGFEAIELFATRSHFDYHDPAAVDGLGEWLAATGIRLHSVHAPIAESYAGGVLGGAMSIAEADRDRRARALHESTLALQLARRIPFDYLVLHFGTPDAFASPGDNSAVDGRRSIEDLHATASAVGVRLALEVIPNRLSSIAALQRLLDDELDLRDAGVCLDVGHAHMMDDVVSVVEEAAGHLFTTHIHDNDGRSDDHLVPYEGTIDWPNVLVALQKVGYDGLMMFEVAASATSDDVLARTRGACRRFEEIVKS